MTFVAVVVEFVAGVTVNGDARVGVDDNFSSSVGPSDFTSDSTVSWLVSFNCFFVSVKLKCGSLNGLSEPIKGFESIKGFVLFIVASSFGQSLAMMVSLVVGVSLVVTQSEILLLLLLQQSWIEFVSRINGLNGFCRWFDCLLAPSVGVIFCSTWPQSSTEKCVTVTTWSIKFGVVLALPLTDSVSLSPPYAIKYKRKINK